MTLCSCAVLLWPVIFLAVVACWSEPLWLSSSTSWHCCRSGTNRFLTSLKVRSVSVSFCSSCYVSRGQFRFCSFNNLQRSQPVDWKWKTKMASPAAPTVMLTIWQSRNTGVMQWTVGQRTELFSDTLLLLLLPLLLSFLLYSFHLLSDSVGTDCGRVHSCVHSSLNIT